jgi:N-acyl-D-amino-acid deacylase
VGASSSHPTSEEKCLDALERRGTAINVGALVGHTPVHLYVMGEESTEREANDEEIAWRRRCARTTA